MSVIFNTIATVDQTGLVTAISAGTATITVKTEDGEFTATCEVTVTPDTGIGTAPQLKLLNTWIQDGILHINGLSAGQGWSVYNISGALVYQGMANSEAATVTLPVRGVYFVRSGNQVVKVVF